MSVGFPFYFEFPGDEHLLNLKENGQCVRRIYLDQKDYSRIAKGLLGGSHFREDLEAYHFLISLSHSQKLLVYSSWCHLLEALKYDEEKIRLLIPYCQAIDSLTNGNCIIWPETIEKKELELFFSKHFGFSTRISEKDYPYGKPKDLISIGDISGNVSEPLQDVLKRNLEVLPLSGTEKKYFSRHLQKPKKLRALLDKFPADNLKALYDRFPGTEKTFTKNKFIDFLLSSTEERADIFESALQDVFTFTNLVTHYSRFFPQLKKVVHCFDDSSSQIRSIITMNQVLYDIFAKQVSESTISNALVDGYANSLNEEIVSLATKYHFPTDEARGLLVKTKFESVTSVKAVIFFVTEYYKRHKGSSQRGRHPLESDLMDLHHLRCLPYVNFYVTDRFFADIAKKGESFFGTKVFLNLSELQKYLVGSKIGTSGL